MFFKMYQEGEGGVGMKTTCGGMKPLLPAPLWFHKWNGSQVIHAFVGEAT